MKQPLLKTVLLLGICVFTGFQAAAQSPNQDVERFALVIGIKGYPNFPEGERLNYADADATMFRDFILTPAGGNFPESHVKLLLNGDATHTRIYEEIEWLGRVTRPYANAVVYVFFAGHGIQDDVGRVFLMPFEGRKDSAMSSGGIRANQFLQDVEDGTNAKHLVFFVDACYAGAVVSSARGNRNVSSEFMDTWKKNFNNIPSIHMGLLSAASNQLSSEDPALEHGLFTYFLVKGLRGEADRNPKDGQVTAGEVYEYVLAEVDKASKAKFKRRQTPIVSPRFDPELALAIKPPLKSLNPEFSSLKIFKKLSMDGATFWAFRNYGESFDSGTTRFIAWEFTIKVPTPGSDIEFHIDTIWTKPDGTTYTQSSDHTLRSNVTKQRFAGNGYGYNEPGKWMPGLYKVDLLLNGVKFASKSFTITNAVTFETQNAKVDFVKFFELGKGNVPPEAQRNYANAFSQPVARYIGWEIEISMSPRSEDLEYTMETVWSKPDGSVLLRQTLPTKVNKDWTGINQVNGGFGSEDPGTWQPGTYTVDFIVNQNKIASGKFTIVKPGFEAQNPKVSFVKFFEKGDGELPTQAQRNYANTFSQPAARYIGWEIEILMSPRPADLEYTMEAVWSKSDGSVLLRQSIPTKVNKDWTGVNQANGGFGSENPGTWQPGTYKVDFFVNQNKIASGTFEIVKLEFEALNPKLNFVKFFEEGKEETPRAQRIYLNTFSRSVARYITWQVDFSMAPRSADFEFTIEAVWSNSAGSVIFRHSPVAKVNKEWKGVSVTGPGYGWKTPGNWQPGTYKVDFFVNQKKVASGSFEIK